MGHDADGNEVEGPVEALLGTVNVDGVAEEKLWMDAVTENPAVGATEVWEFYNTTGDAHPMHVHEVVFEVVNREGLVLDEDDEVVEPIQLDGEITPPEPWETGFKDTVIAYPGQVTRVKALLRHAGPVRLALPHRRARGQRDDAAIPHRTGSAGRARQLKRVQRRLTTAASAATAVDLRPGLRWMPGPAVSDLGSAL